MTENSGKTTLSVDEDDILRYAEKIRLNHQEDKAFEEIIVRFVDVSQDKINEQITIGKTPYSLVLAGADGDLPLTISPETIIKCMGDANEVYHGHSLSEEIMKQLPGELRVPTLILKGSHKNSLVAVTELRDEENNIIIAAVELNSRRARQEVNRVTSAYGKNNVQQYIDRQVNKEHNLIACNKEKADKMFQSLGLQLPPEETFIGFDNSIAFSSENVKGFSEIILENIPPRKENDMENKQNSADNAPREEITDTDLVVGLVESGFHVYLDDTDRQLTFEKIYDYFDDYGRLKDGHTFTVPMMEVAQFGALEALCEKFESFNDIVRADGGLHADSGLPGLSLKDYADELLDDEESHFEWRNGQSEWENVRRGILLGETKFLHNFLYDAAFDYPSRAADIREDLNDYETTNFKEKQTDKTFAYDIGHSAPFTVVHLDVSTEERKNAVSQALKTIINSFGERNDMSQPYKNLLEDIKPTVDFLDASQGHLSALKYALRNAETNKELCLSMLDSIKIAENSPEKTVIIKGYDCLPKDAWENNGIKFTIGQSVDDMSFYYARATDGKITRDYEYDYEPDKEKVMSDHADKLAQEDMDCGEAIYGADGHRAFPDPEMKHLVVFEYNGYHFEPIGKIDSKSTLREIGNAIVSNKGTLDMSVYQGSRLPYSYEKFYAAANSEADVFRCIENGKLYLPGENELFEYTGEILSLAKEKAVEHIPQTQDISHKTTNADLSATRGNNINNNAELSAARMTLGHSNANGQKRSIIMSNNTKLGVSSMTISDDENSAIKAFAAVTVNDEFVIKNIKVIEGDKGLFVAMPSRKISGEYQDVVFPITKEAREQLNNAVIECYNDMQSKGQERFMADNTSPEKSVSNITASIYPQDYENSHVKGSGQIVIDGAFVVSGVKVVEGKDGQIFASMPSYTNDVDERKDYAFPITKECYEKVQNAVLEDYAYIQNYHEMGGKENLSTAYNLNAGFADKLSEELNKQGIENLVKKSDGRANITVKLEDKDKFAEIRKDFAQKLQNERDGGKKSLSQRIEKAKAQQPEKAAEQTPAKQPHKKPNSQEL